MKQIVLFSILFISTFSFAQSQASAGSPGYEIRISFKPFKNQYIYLGHYEGKQLPVIDSVMVNNKSEGVFKGSKKLGAGVYLIGYPNKMGFFEFLIGKDQHFSIKADTSDLRNVSYKNSPENELFTSYQRFMAASGKRIDATQRLLASSKNKKD